MNIPNLATEFLKTHGETTADWDGDCGGLADKLIGPDDSILYVEGDEIRWRYHMVPLIKGLVHDAWCDGPALPVPEWLSKMFGDAQITLALNGDDIYSGPANQFNLPKVVGMPHGETIVVDGTFGVHGIPRVEYGLLCSGGF